MLVTNRSTGPEDRNPVSHVSTSPIVRLRLRSSIPGVRVVEYYHNIQSPLVALLILLHFDRLNIDIKYPSIGNMARSKQLLRNAKPSDKHKNKQQLPATADEYLAGW